MRNMITIVCALAILAWAGQALGVAPTDYNFNNAGGDSLWMTSNNWLAEDSSFGPPNDPSDDNAWIGDGLTAELRSTTIVATPKRMKVGTAGGAGIAEIYTGAELDVTLGGAQWFGVGATGDGNGDGTLRMLGGTVTCCGFSVGGTNQTGTVDLQSGVIDAVSIGVCGIGVGGGYDAAGATGTITQTGGTLNLRSTADNAGLYLGSTENWHGNMNDCTGLYNISGGTLNQYGDGNTVGGMVLGPKENTSYPCSGTTGTFHVTSAWETGVDNIKVNAFRMFAPGDNQAILVCDIDGALGIEKTVVANAATFDGTLEVNTLGAGHAGTYTLMTYASATGDFDTTDLPGGWTYNIGATDLTVTVPEPATLTLLGLGGLGVLIRRKRR